MNCKRYKAWMADAATDGLLSRRRAEFEAHVGVCSACREEFARVGALVEAIDRGVAAQASIEPSPDFVARVRQRIAAEAAPTKMIWARWQPAAACAAVIFVAAAIWIIWPRAVMLHEVVSTKPPAASLAAANHAAPNTSGAGRGAIRPNPSPAAAAMRRVAVRSPRRIERQLETPRVIVPPGQEKALLQFAAALQSGKLDGAKLIAAQQEADQPIEIKPLVIPLLDSTAQEQDKIGAPDGQGSKRDFVRGESTQGLLP